VFDLNPFRTKAILFRRDNRFRSDDHRSHGIRSKGPRQISPPRRLCFHLVGCSVGPLICLFVRLSTNNTTPSLFSRIWWLYWVSF